MKILNYGSLNIDHVYRVDHFARPGETLSSIEYNRFCGGKGLNQSIALSLAGAKVFHAGKTGRDGGMLVEKLKKCGVDTRYVTASDTVTGHAVIQVNKEGENCIILNGGANRTIMDDEIEAALGFFDAGDYVLLQNEINSIDRVLKTAKQKGLVTVFNPAPMNNDVLAYPLELVDVLIVNQIEGSDLTGEHDTGKILLSLADRFKDARIVLTMGADGVKYIDNESRHHVPAVPAKAVDTTAAGDTFIGYYLSCIMEGLPARRALETACTASALCISRRGAADSIPARNEIDKE